MRAPKLKPAPAESAQQRIWRVMRAAQSMNGHFTVAAVASATELTQNCVKHFVWVLAQVGYVERADKAFPRKPATYALKRNTGPHAPRKIKVALRDMNTGEVVGGPDAG